MNVEHDSADDASIPPSTATINEHLTFPSTSAEAPHPESFSSPRQLLKDRLYIGNLHPSVDEYSLLQVFSKFGKVTKLDFLFHKAGALKGKPRGYAFIEYGSNVEATKALTMAHNKLLRGRKLVVTYAHQAPIEHIGMSGSGMKRKAMMETGRPTTLSLLKTSTSTRNDGTTSKIAMMEAKLRQMESTNPKPTTSSDSIANTSDASDATPPAVPASLHPSLPPKPPTPIPIPESTLRTNSRPGPKPNLQQTLPSLPISPPPPNNPTSVQVAAPADVGSKTGVHRIKSKLVGVKIGKAKEKGKGKDEDKSEEKDGIV